MLSLYLPYKLQTITLTTHNNTSTVKMYKYNTSEMMTPKSTSCRSSSNNITRIPWKLYSCIFCILNSNNTSFLFPRTQIPPEEVQEYAALRAQKGRQCRQIPGDDLLFPPKMKTQYGRNGSKAHITPGWLALEVSGAKPDVTCKTWDNEYMCNYLRGCDMTKVRIPRFVPFNIIYNLEAPLLDFLVNNENRHDSWKVQDSSGTFFSDMAKCRGIDWSVVKRVEQREVVVGQTVGESLESTLDWARDNHQHNLSEIPLDLMSLDCEEISVPKDVYEKILKGDVGDVITFPTVPKKGIKCTQVPTKIMLGDGVNWVLIISIHVKYSEDGTAALEIPDVQVALYDFLEQLPVVTGVGIDTDVMEIEELFQAWTGDNFKMQGFLPLPSLAVLAGWNFPFCNMTALSTQLIGAILNKEVSRGDNKWGLPWHKITPALRIYGIGDVKFGFHAMHILFRILLIDLFPDPDVVLAFTRVDSRLFVRRFNDWIVKILVGTVIDFAAIKEATTRAELTQTIRFWTAHGKKSKVPPSRVLALSACFGGWPSLTNGGCRYLHQARAHFVTQCRLLKESDCLSWVTDIMPYDVTDEMVEAATYTLSDLQYVSFKDPVMDDIGLSVHADLLPKTIVSRPPQWVTSRNVLAFAKTHKRVAREVFYEWVRMNLSGDSLEQLFERFPRDKHFWTYLRSYYNETRRIYARACGLDAPRNIDCDERNRATADAALAREKESVDALRHQLSLRVNRMAFFANIKMDSDRHVNSQTFRLQVPEIKSRTAIKQSRLEYKPAEEARELPPPPSAKADSGIRARAQDWDEDLSEGRHRAKKARTGWQQVTKPDIGEFEHFDLRHWLNERCPDQREDYEEASRSPPLITQDEFEETIGRPPPHRGLEPEPLPAPEAAVLVEETEDNSGGRHRSRRGRKAFAARHAAATEARKTVEDVTKELFSEMETLEKDVKALQQHSGMGSRSVDMGVEDDEFALETNASNSPGLYGPMSSPRGPPVSSASTPGCSRWRN